MESSKGQNLSLFGEGDLKQIRPTGSPWAEENPNDPATVPIPLQVIMVKVDGPYTERDRKLWTFLLHAVWDDLEKEPLHSLSIADVNRVFRDRGGDHNTEWIWESAKRLAKTTVEWEYTLGDERLQGISSIFGAVVSKPSRATGRLKFHFPPLLIPIIKQPQRFARLRTHFLIGLSGKYAVTMYELLEGFANKKDGSFICSLNDLRAWLKVKDGLYPDWKDFKKRVLDPALEQINENPTSSGFSVAYTAYREGRSYNRLRFVITKAQHRAQSEMKIRSKIAIAQAIAEGKERGRPVLLRQSIEKAQTATKHLLDMELVEQEFWAYWENTGRPFFRKGLEAAFVGFAKKKAADVRAGRR